MCPSAAIVSRLVSMAVMACAALGMLTVSALAQGADDSGWPKQPIRILVGFTPGGSNDLLARVLAPRLSERLGQPVVVENRPGAGGRLAAELVARAPADGYTLIVIPAGALTIAPAVYAKLNYDPVKSFSHIAVVVTYPFILTVNASHPVKNVKELIAFAKANPDKANYGSTSAIFQLISELFNTRAGVKFEHIPFKSGGEIVAGILNGQVVMAFADTGASLSHIKGGKLRALATSGAKRFAELPDLPTVVEAGVPGVAVDGFSGISGPPGMSRTIVKRLEREVNAIIPEKEFGERLRQLGLVAGGGTSEEFSAMIARDIPIWTAVAQAANIKLD